MLNKLKNAKEVFIDKVSPELRDSSAHKASTDFLSSTSRDTQNPTTKQEISKDIESKSTTQEIIKQARKSGKSVAETKELLQKHKELQAANNQKIKEFEKKLYQSDELARKMEYISDSSGLSTKSYSHNENLERYFKDKFIDVDDFLTLKKLDKNSAEYKALLEKMYYKQQEQKANVKALGDLDSNVVAEQSQDYMQNYIKQIHNMSEQELINERKKLLTMPLHNDNMRLINAQMQQALESFMYPNMKYFTQNPTIYTFLRNGEKFDKRNGAKKLSLQEFDTYRKMLEQDLNLTPAKEFGANYAEYYRDGVGAIQKLINEAQAHKQSGAKGEYKGQVSGAFYRKELGDIDLVWGDSNFGLAHILQERTKQWGEEKALRFISHLSENIQKGHIVEVEKGRIGIKTELTTIILDKKDGNNFVITAFRDSGNKKELESLNLIQSKALTSENAGTNAKESPVTSLNQESIIPQTPQEIIKQAKASGKSVKETKELLQKHNKEIQSIRTEIRKDIATRQKNIEQGYIDIVSSHHAKIGKKGGYTTKMYLETDKEKQSYLYDGFNKESVDNYLQLVKENAPLKERNKALDKLVNERLEAEERFSQLQKQQEELEDKQLQAFDEESFIKSLEGKSKDELENIQGDLWSKSNSKNSDIPFPVIARMSNLVMWIKDKIPQAAFNNDELREAIKSLRFREEYKDDINSIQYFKENREFIEQTLNIKPIKEFGTNYAEHYHSGESAIAKLINEAQAHKESGAKGEYKGQVAGAFHRKELGDIDLVWGQVEGKGKEAKGWGLAKIIEKHGDEFSSFSGNTEEQKLINGINEIIQNGKLLTENGVNTLYLQKDNKVFLVGLSKGWHNKGDNQWVITSYEAKNLHADILEKIGANKTISADESLNALQTFNATDSNIIPQTPQEIVKNNNIKESANMLESKVKMQGQDLNLIYNTQEAKHIATLRTDLKEALSPYLNKEIVNKATGITAQISTTGLNKIASTKAIDKSVANGFSRDEHFKVAQDLKTLFENATKKESYADKKQSNDVMAMHRFFAEIIINNKQAQAKMTLKESIEHGNRIYSLELEELIPSINAQPHTKEAQARGS